MSTESLLGRTLLVVAHPDDETVGAGVLLQRITAPVVVFCTDGAPRDEFFWRRHGSRLRYARVREEEARNALSLAGVTELIFLAQEAGARELFADQELFRAIAEALTLLGDIVRRYRPQALVTLAYEGGHPDHDVCSFLAAVLAREYRLPCWEFPLYHRRQGAHIAQTEGIAEVSAPSAESKNEVREMVFQRFLVAGMDDEFVLEVTPDELERKRQMLAAYGSQHPFLLEFDPAVERFRRQHAYDYLRPPHVGTLNYEAWQWPVTAEDVCVAFSAFQDLQQRRIA